MTFSELRLMLLDETSAGRQVYAVTQPFRFESCLGLQVCVPDGFTTDFASVPRPFWRWFPPAGPHAKAAVIHDYLYSVDAECPRFLADAVFRHAMQVSGVPAWKRMIMYYTVRLFGWASYHRR